MSLDRSPPRRTGNRLGRTGAVWFVTFSAASVAVSAVAAAINLWKGGGFGESVALPFAQSGLLYLAFVTRYARIYEVDEAAAGRNPFAWMVGLKGDDRSLVGNFRFDWRKLEPALVVRAWAAIVASFAIAIFLNVMSIAALVVTLRR